MAELLQIFNDYLKDFELLQIVNGHLKDFEPWQIVLGTTCIIQFLHFLFPALQNVFGKNLSSSFRFRELDNFENWCSGEL